LTDLGAPALTNGEAAVNIRNAAILLALSRYALGCGTHTVDLDTAWLIRASNEPGVLGIVRERIEKVAVDDQRLYWIGTRADPAPAKPNAPPPTDGGVRSLHSCQKRDCAHTLITYDAAPGPLGGFDARAVFSVSGDHIYWYRPSSRELLDCPVAGCNDSPRPLATELEFSAVAFDKDRIFFTSVGAIYSLPLREPGPLRPVAAPPGMLHGLVVRDAYVYWLAMGVTGMDGERQNALVRTRSDGSSTAFETISNDVRHASSSDFNFTTDAASIYWAENLLAGSVHRCPLTGCSGTSELVLERIRSPQKLLIDGSELYYTYEANPYQYALANCSLSACAPSLPSIEHLDAPGAVALDDEYLYVASTEQDVSPNSSDVDIVSKIRRLPKADPGAP
jgi:hypothetical protein